MPNAQDDHLSMGSSFQEQSPYQTSSVVTRATSKPPFKSLRLNVRKSLHPSSCAGPCEMRSPEQVNAPLQAVHCCAGCPHPRRHLTQCCQLAALVLRVQLASTDLLKLKSSSRLKAPRCDQNPQPWHPSDRIDPRCASPEDLTLRSCSALLSQPPS